MAFPGDISKIVLSGQLPGGEVWATGWYARTNYPTSSAQQQADSLKSRPWLTGAMADWFNTYQTANVTCDRVTVYEYTSGRTAVDVGSAAISGVGGGSAASLPNQVALVATLRSALATASGRGRMFLPLTGATAMVIGTGKVQPTCATNLAIWVAAAMEDTAGYVVSETRTLKSEITRVTVDNVADTIRARSQRLVRTSVSRDV